MPAASQAIFAANRQGRLGLVIYAIPNFPDPVTYSALLADLAARPAVSVLETTYPVEDRYSEYANDTIRDAHRAALSHGHQGLAAVDHLRSFDKPTICVLYQATYEDEGLTTIVRRARGNLQGILFEWEIDSVEDAAGVITSQGIEVIHCAGDYMDDTEVDELLATLPHEALVYFESAAMTGAALSNLDEMRRFAQRLKTGRPDLCLAAGFGVKTPADVAGLASIEEMNAVIIGTRYLEVAKDGREAAARYLSDIAEALER